MIKSFVLHSMDYDRIAAAERWYRQKHGPEIADRYGAWLSVLVSYRPVPMPRQAEAYGLTNWLCTVGMWRETPMMDTGSLAMTPPPQHAHPYGCFTGPMPENDWKGRGLSADNLVPLRWLQLLRWPRGVDAAIADAWFVDRFAAQACACSGLKRFFSYCCLPEGTVQLPGYWDEETQRSLQGSPEDHRWDRVVEMWFDSISAWSDFVQTPFSAPPWAQEKTYPFVKPGQDFMSAFLLEAPEFVWKKG